MKTSSYLHYEQVFICQIWRPLHICTMNKSSYVRYEDMCAKCNTNLWWHLLIWVLYLQILTCSMKVFICKIWRPLHILHMIKSSYVRYDQVFICKIWRPHHISHMNKFSHVRYENISVKCNTCLWWHLLIWTTLL